MDGEGKATLERRRRKPYSRQRKIDSVAARVCRSNAPHGRTASMRGECLSPLDELELREGHDVIRIPIASRSAIRRARTAQTHNLHVTSVARATVECANLPIAEMFRVLNLRGGARYGFVKRTGFQRLDLWGISQSE